MTSISCALALLSGVIGAGFASGREIAHFLSSHGPLAPIAALLAVLTLYALFCRLPAQMERAGAASLSALCRTRFGERFGRLCAGLFFLLFAITGGAMLAACAELAALTLPLRRAYGVGLLLSLIAGTLLAARGLSGLALPGALLCAALPALLLRLIALPGGEAVFSPAGRALRAAGHGISYGALSAAQMTGALPLLLPLKRAQRRRASLVFSLLFLLLLALGVCALHRHRQASFMQPLPFVYLSRALGKGGYYLCALCMYAAALSTLCAMLASLMHMLPGHSALLSALCCLIPACMGFDSLISRGYPMLGALCAALMALLCLPDRQTPHQLSSSER